MSRRIAFRWVASIAAGASLVGAWTWAAAEPYFPEAGSRDWARSDPVASGWDLNALEGVIDYAHAQSSTGIVIVQNGRIVAERYWRMEVAEPYWRKAPVEKVRLGAYPIHYYHGETPEGWPIEDVASIQKSVTSVLFGIAQGKGLVDVRRSVSSYIGNGWSKAPRDREDAITVQHLLTMTSGLDERLQYEAPAGTRWFYNTTAYAQLDDVLGKFTGRAINDVTTEWLTGPLGMTDSRWVERVDGLVIGSNNIGFVTTPRDLARFGVLLLGGGVWDGKDVIVSANWLRTSFSPSQDHNPSYGYLWWVNSAGSAERRLPGEWVVPGAPADLVAAIGHFTRRLYIVPSLSLVVVRFGPEADVKNFDREIWTRLMRAVPKVGELRSAASLLEPTHTTRRR